MDKNATEVSNYKLDPNLDSAAANVLRFVGCNKKVLEIRAGPPLITRALVEENKCSVTAIGPDDKYIDIIRGFCDFVLPWDLDDSSWVGHLPQNEFDAIVIADILERLVDPWAMLRLAASCVRETRAA